MSKKLKPWEVEGVPWKTEAAYWSWVRGILRQGWGRHPVKVEYVKKNRIRVNNPNPNRRVETTWGMKCRKCEGEFIMPVTREVRKRIEEGTGEELVVIEINHKTAASNLRCKEDLAEFASKLLFVNFDDLEPLCQTCHRIHTYSEKEGVSFEEAKAQKQAIEIIKKKEDRVFLESKGITAASNAKGRREQIVNYLKEGNNV